eukprot:3867724-Rhodomonas_salina.2
MSELEHRCVKISAGHGEHCKIHASQRSSHEVREDLVCEAREKENDVGGGEERAQEEEEGAPDSNPSVERQERESIPPRHLIQHTCECEDWPGATNDGERLRREHSVEHSTDSG